MIKMRFSEEVSGALHFGRPIVALESTVIAHGLPFPTNLETAYNVERIIRDAGVTPATIAVFDGEITVGLSDAEFERLANRENILKLSRKDLPFVTAMKLSGATTVAATSLIANRAGIRVFATGGIGGVHRGDRTDVSADLPELARTPMIVVCSGAKIVLDLAATREWLETFGVTVLGWQCDEFPAFYSRTSGLKVDRRVESGREVAKIADSRSELGFTSSILVAVPVPEHAEMRSDELEPLLLDALREAKERAVKGKELTPFLLARMSARSNNRTLAANVALLENNAKVAAEIAMNLNS